MHARGASQRATREAIARHTAHTGNRRGEHHESESDPDAVPGDPGRRPGTRRRAGGNRDREARRFADEFSRLILICGRYEGVDERVAEHLVTDEISIGDYVLTGGEIPAMVVVDAVTRLLPNTLGSETSALRDSFSEGLLDYPHYTRPAEFRGWRAPEVLVSGHHGEVEKWRRRAALLKTLKTRPDLIEKAALTDDERRWLDDVMRVENIQS